MISDKPTSSLKITKSLRRLLSAQWIGSQQCRSDRHHAVLQAGSEHSSSAEDLLLLVHSLSSSLCWLVCLGTHNSRSAKQRIYQKLLSTFLANTSMFHPDIFCNIIVKQSKWTLIMKPTRFTNISNLFLEQNSTCFGQAGPLACWDLEFESPRGHGYLSVVSVVCCQVEVSATSWSLV